MSDYIKRSDAIKALEREKSDWNNDYNVPIDNCIKRLNKVKSADRPQGEWVQDPIVGNIMYCSNCQISYTKNFLRGMSLYREPKDTPKFCPNCGADMRERKESE